MDTNNYDLPVPEMFPKIRLRPAQLKTVAERRFDDAKCLRDSDENERANGAIYMAGFVIECLLKARLVQKYPWLGVCSSTDGLSKSDRSLWSLCHRSHDLDEILKYLPEVYNPLAIHRFGEPRRLTASLKSICLQWTIFARYSPKMANIADADDFILRVKEIKEWLKL